MALGGMVSSGITIKFNANTSGLEAGAAKANAVLGGFASAALAVGAVVGAAMLAGGVASVKMAADFQQGVTRLVTGAGDVTDNMTKMGDGILQTSVATGVLATGTQGLNAAMYLIISSGQRGGQALDTLSAAAKGAQIEQASVVDVANTLSGVMTNYGTKTFTATQYMNGLITAVQQGKITLQDLSTAMGPIDPIAQQLGIHFNDTAAAMTTQTNAMIPAARAATGLRFMMTALENPTKKAKDAMSAMGLDSVAVANEMKVSLPGALQMIYDAAKKAGPEGSVPFNRAVGDMVGGIRSLSTFTALTGPHMADFVKNSAAILTSMLQNKNAIMGWDAAQANFNIKMDQAKAALNVFAITVGSALLPELGRLVDQLTPIIVGFGDWLVKSGALTGAVSLLVAGIKGMSDGLSSTVAFFQQNEAAMVMLKVGVIALAGAIGGALVAALILATVNFIILNAAALPWIALALAIGAAVALLVAGFILLYNASQPVRTFMAMLGGIFSQLGATIVSELTPAWNQLVAAFQKAAPIFLVIAQVLGGVLLVALGVIVAAVAGLAQGLAVALTGIVIVITGVVNIISGIAQILGGLFMALMDVITGRSDEAAAHLAMAWNGVLLMFQGFGQAVLGVFVAFFGLIIGFIAGFVTTIISYFQHLAAVVVGNSIVPDMVNAIISWFEQLPGRAGAAIASLITTAIAKFNQLNADAVNAVIAMVNGVVSQLQSLVGRAGAAIASVASTIIGGLNGIVGAATAAGANIVNGIAAGITGAIGAVGSAIGSVTQYIADHLPKSPAKIGPLRGLAFQGREISNQISQGMISGQPLMQGAMNKLAMPIYASLAGGKTQVVASAAAPIIIQVQPNDLYLDGRKMTEAFVDRTARGLRLQGVKNR